MALGFLLLGSTFLLIIPSAHADSSSDSQNKQNLTPDDTDFKKTPFTEYGSVNEDAEEDAETRFLQYGRLFGVSLGIGDEGAFGNRGQLWQGGFPMIDVKMLYWFDFRLALDLDFSTAKHSFESDVSGAGLINETSTRIGIDLRYYFNVNNLSAPISFANPFILGGVGSFSKTQTPDGDPNSSQNDTSLYLNAGLGLEFAISPKKAYFDFEGKIISATFNDTNTSSYQQTHGLNDLSGAFFTLTGSFLFTW